MWPVKASVFLLLLCPTVQCPMPLMQNLKHALCAHVGASPDSCAAMWRRLVGIELDCSHPNVCMAHLAWCSVTVVWAAARIYMYTDAAGVSVGYAGLTHYNSPRFRPSCLFEGLGMGC